MKHDRIIAEMACDYAIVAALDDDGRVVLERVSAGFARLLGLPEADPLGELFSRGSLRARKARSFVHADDFATAEQRMRLFLDGPWRECQDEFRAIAKSGAVRWLRLTTRRQRDADGGTTHIYATVHDVTAERLVHEGRQGELDASQEQLHERTRELESVSRRLQRVRDTTDRLRGRGSGQDLAGRVAHAIRTPLAALIESLERELADRDAGSSSRLENALAQARQVEELVGRSLALFGQGELELAPVVPAALLSEVAARIAPAADAARVEVSVSRAAELEALPVDRARLGAALVSVAENAVEGAGPGGHVWLGLEASGQGCEFTIADDGPGIPPELRERVFEPFFTRRSTGSGLGLAIALGVVEAHSGRIHLATREGGGALFRVEIPG